MFESTSEFISKYSYQTKNNIRNFFGKLSNNISDGISSKFSQAPQGDQFGENGFEYTEPLYQSTGLYIGETKGIDSIPHGAGTLYKDATRSGIIFRGTWKKGKMLSDDGTPTEIKIDDGNKVIQGRFTRGNFNGECSIYDYRVNGDLRFRGDLRNGRRHGNGTEYNINEATTYEGDFSQNAPSFPYMINEVRHFENIELGGWDGVGTEYDETGGHLIYRGEFRNGKRQGYGTEFDQNGNTTFVGIWKEDQKIHGRVTEYEGNTPVFEGFLRRGQKDKSAKIYEVENDQPILVYKGGYLKDAPHGYGKQYEVANGQSQLKYKGRFSKGKKSLWGTEYRDGEKSFKGYYYSNFRTGKGREYENGQQKKGYWIMGEKEVRGDPENKSDIYLQGVKVGRKVEKKVEIDFDSVREIGWTPQTLQHFYSMDQDSGGGFPSQQIPILHNTLASMIEKKSFFGEYNFLLDDLREMISIDLESRVGNTHVFGSPTWPFSNAKKGIERLEENDRAAIPYAFWGIDGGHAIVIKIEKEDDLDENSGGDKYKIAISNAGSGIQHHEHFTNDQSQPTTVSFTVDKDGLNKFIKLMNGSGGIRKRDIGYILTGLLLGLIGSLFDLLFLASSYLVSLVNQITPNFISKFIKKSAGSLPKVIRDLRPGSFSKGAYKATSYFSGISNKIKKFYQGVHNLNTEEQTTTAQNSQRGETCSFASVLAFMKHNMRPDDYWIFIEELYRTAGQYLESDEFKESSLPHDRERLEQIRIENEKLEELRKTEARYQRKDTSRESVFVIGKRPLLSFGRLREKTDQPREVSYREYDQQMQEI